MGGFTSHHSFAFRAIRACALHCRSAVVRHSGREIAGRAKKKLMGEPFRCRCNNNVNSARESHSWKHFRRVRSFGVGNEPVRDSLSRAVIEMRNISLEAACI